jgi:hypothetical protein
MAKEKSLVEEAIIQMKNLEEAVAENAKGILASTMKQEIKDLVKESLSEQDDDEVETDDVEMDEPMGSDDIADMDMGDDSDEEGDEMDTDDMDDEDDMDFGDEEDDDEDTIDLTDADDEEVLRVFQLMGPDDNIVVTKDDEGNIHLKDDETGKEYMIVGESEEDNYEMFEDWNESEEMYEEMDDELYEDDMMDGETIEDIVEKMFNSNPEDEESEFSFSEFDEEEGMDGDSIVYEIEMGDDDSEEYLDMEEDDSYDMEDQVMESKSTIKPKGVGMGKPKFSYDSKPNQGEGFKTKMKQGPRTMGTGKAKFEYKEGENAGSKLGKNKMVKKVESKEGSTRKPMVKKVETKEASRTLGAGSNFRKGGLPKPRAHSSFNTAIKESSSNKELQILREKNEEYRKALNVFRSKLNEVAVFNSNLAYATRLFTEHSTSKQEKINILRRFDGVETIKESKNLYQVVKNELSSGTKSQPMNESIERTIAKSPSTGAVNLLESKTYENPQFLRMKDLMAKIK